MPRPRSTAVVSAMMMLVAAVAAGRRGVASAAASAAASSSASAPSSATFSACRRFFPSSAAARRHVAASAAFASSPCLPSSSATGSSSQNRFPPPSLSSSSSSSPRSAQAPFATGTAVIPAPRRFSSLHRWRLFSSSASVAEDDVSSGEGGGGNGNGGGFFADPSVHPTFASLGVTSPALLERVESYLRRTSPTAEEEGEVVADVRPSAVQAAAYPSISSGRDVTLGAETGSGKTLAYLLPLLDDILRRKRENGNKGNGYLGYDYTRAVILVPNKELVNQVVRTACELGGGEGRCVVSNSGDPLDRPWGSSSGGGAAADDDENVDDDDESEIVRIAVLPGGLSNPRDFRPFRRTLSDPGKYPPADIVVTTPANLGPMGLSPKNVDLFADVETLVIDEADMLLDGGYVKQLNNVLMGFRRADRLVVDKGIRSFFDEEEEGGADEGDGRGGGRGGRDNFGARKTQHVLVAATLPDVGLKSVDAYIRKKFPRAERVALDGMHNARHGGLKERTVWLMDDEESIRAGSWNKVRMGKLVKMLRTDPSGERNSAEADDDEEEGEAVGLRGEKVMVFLNTVDDVEGATAALTTEGIPCVPYHAKLGLGERTSNLDRFRRYRATSQGVSSESDEKAAKSKDEESPVPVLVCTDLASRGLDVPSVSAIVQLQFAGNVVAHLHRMGRTGRAGRVDGRGVVFYGERERELVEVVREAERNQDRMGLEQDVEDDEEEAVDGDEEGSKKKKKADKGKVGAAFSRRRGFTRKRKKLKREAAEAAAEEEERMRRETTGGGEGQY